MNLVIFPLLCLTILVHQTICQDESYKKNLCEHEDIQTLIVKRHNELRSQVKPAPANMLRMEWNKEAAVNAKKWAVGCKYVHSKSPERQITTLGCGENLYMSNRPHNWQKVMDGWFDERKDFDYGTGAKTQGAIVGHYTQFVSFKSHQLGCALAYCSKQDLPYFYVCHYCPAGNSVNTLHNPYETGDECAKCKDKCKSGLCENACGNEDIYEGCFEFADWCDDEDIHENCKATCSCPDQIF